MPERDVDPVPFAEVPDDDDRVDILEGVEPVPVLEPADEVPEAEVVSEPGVVADEHVVRPTGPGSGGDSGEYDLTPEPEPPPRKPIDAARRVVTKSEPCRACGYDLFGLPRDGRCPECGTPITQDEETSLATADPAWRSAVATGCRMDLWGLVAAAAVAVPMVGLLRSVPLAAAAAVPGAAVAAVGVWTLTRPRPVAVRREAPLATAARVAVPFNVAVLVAVGLMGLPNATPGGVRLLLTAASLLALPAMASHVLAALYLRRLAEGLPGDELRERLELAAWGMAGSFGAVALLGGLAVFGRLSSANPAAPLIAAGGACGLAVVGLFALLALGFVTLYLVALEAFARAVRPSPAEVVLEAEVVE